VLFLNIIVFESYFCISVKLIKIYIILFFGLLVWSESEAQFDLNSDGNWKTSETATPGWLNPSFDDSSWPNSIAPAQNPGGATWPPLSTSMWVPNAAGDSAFFRKAFELRSSCVTADDFLVSADNEFDVWINGTYVGGRKNLGRLTVINVASYLRIGYNVVCIRAYSFNPPSMVRALGKANYTSGPIIDLGADKYVCDGDSTFVTTNHNYQRYDWSDGQSSRTAEFSVQGRYWNTARDTAGCPWVDTVEVFSYKVKPVELGPDTSICDGDQATFNADPDNAYSRYKWSTGDTTKTITVGYQDLFRVTVTDKNECTASDFRKTRVFVSGTAVNLGQDTILCKGDSLKINAFFPQSRYKWSDGTTDSNFIITQAGNYEVTVTNFCGEAIDEIAIQYISELSIDLGEDQFLCSNLELDIGQKVAGVLSYKWSTGASSAFIKTTVPGIYSVHVIDYCGNEGQDDIEIIKELNPDAIIPSAFSPNNDALNETWRTYVRPKSYFNVKVIDQWSRIVFESSNHLEEWDGSNEGGPLPVGKYIYTVEWDECENQPQTAQGSITIVR